MSGMYDTPPGARLYYDFTRDPFAQKSLDLSYTSRPFDNLLTNPQFADNNGDGRPDYWSTYTPTGIVGYYSLENGYAKIELTESKTASTGAQFSQYITDIAPGQIFSCRCVAKVSAPGVRARLQISYFIGGKYGGVMGNTVSTTDATDALLSVENAIVPADATKIQILLRLIPNASGNTGVGWFKSPELIRHSTFKQPNKSAMLYGPKWAPDGLEFDGVDDYCIVENNADADITVATRERPLTISVVARPKGDVQSYLFAKNNDANTNQYGILSVPSRLRFRTNDLGAMFSSGVPVVANEILFYVVTYDGVSLDEYKNGRLVSTTNVSGTLTSRNHIHIGCRKSTSAREYYYKGTISEIYIGHAQPDELISWFERTGRFEKYGIPR